MELSDILSKVDHTVLGQASTLADIKTLCDDGIKYGCASVCLPPSFVKKAKEFYHLILELGNGNFHPPGRMGVSAYPFPHKRTTCCARRYNN